MRRNSYIILIFAIFFCIGVGIRFGINATFATLGISALSYIAGFLLARSDTKVDDIETKR